MRKYEMIVIFSPTLGETELNAEITKVQNLITSNGGKDLSVDKWGRKEIAYVVKKQKFGNFVVFNFASDESTTIDRVSRILVITESVLKFQTHVMDTRRRKVKSSSKPANANKSSGEDALFSEVEY